MQRLSMSIADLCIGREFHAAMVRSPLTDSGTQRARNSCPAHLLDDVNTFEKQHGRCLAAVDVVATHRGFGKANWCVIVR